MKRHSLLLEITLNVVLLSLALSMSLFFIFNALEKHYDNQAQSLLQAKMMTISENVLAGYQTEELKSSYNAQGEESTTSVRYQIQLSTTQDGYVIQLFKDQIKLYEWELVP